MDRSEMLEQLNVLIFDGWEFPEALDFVVSENGLTLRQSIQLTTDYDDQ